MQRPLFVGNGERCEEQKARLKSSFIFEKIRQQPKPAYFSLKYSK
jgi:hypothetical protein